MGLWFSLLHLWAPCVKLSIRYFVLIQLTPQNKKHNPHYKNQNGWLRLIPGP